MSDFGAELDLDPNAIIDRLTQIKEDIQGTFSGGQNLELKFPSKAYSTIEFYPEQEQYKLQWTRDKQARYESAYVTFTRAGQNLLAGNAATSTMIKAMTRSGELNEVDAKKSLSNARPGPKGSQKDQLKNNLN